MPEGTDSRLFLPARLNRLCDWC